MRDQEAPAWPPRICSSITADFLHCHDRFGGTYYTTFALLFLHAFIDIGGEIHSFQSHCSALGKDKPGPDGETVQKLLVCSEDELEDLDSIPVY